MPNAPPLEWVGLKFKKWERVRTASSLDKRDYTEEGQLSRRPDAIGTITDLSNSHGLCFRVDYDGGGSGWFDPDELCLM